MIFEVFIPLLPPGINQTYGLGKRNAFDEKSRQFKVKSIMYKREEAVDWADGASKIIGAKAGELGWEDDSKFYSIDIKFNGWNFDVDAPDKLILDTLSQKLGFDDKRIMKLCIEKAQLGETGVWIRLEPYGEDLMLEG